MSNSKTSIIQALRDYFNKCALLEDCALEIDGSLHNTKAFSIGTMPVDEVLKKYLGGSSLRQYVFELIASYPQADTQEQNAKNAAFFEEFSDWLCTQSSVGNLPILPDNCTARKIETLSNGYFQSDDNSTRLYAMQCRIVYFKKS